MNFGVFTTWWLIGLGLALIVGVVARGFWLYHVSLAWPTTDGVITRIDIKRQCNSSSTGGHYFSATFTYDFRDPRGHRVSGSWYKNFSTESEAKEFAERELLVEKKVVVRFSSIRRALFRTILTSIRGLIRVTGQPVLTFSVADVAADTLPGKS